MDFTQEGIVSLWAGRFADEEDLFAYVDFIYDEDGNSFNLFAAHAGITWFDHDFQEANFLGATPTDWCAALTGHSYLESFGDNAAAALTATAPPDCNSVFLLYDFAYVPEAAQPAAASRLGFIGRFPYEITPS